MPQPRARSNALLLSHLRKAGTRFPADLFQLETDKLLSDPQTPERHDRDTAPFTEGALLGDAVAFFENLDDVSYANNFGMAGFTMPTFEAAITTAMAMHGKAAVAGAPRDKVPLKSLTGPTGALLGGTPGDPRIWLAARGPIQDPFFLGARILEEGETDPLASGKTTVALEALRRCEIRSPQTGEATARLVARSGPWAPSSALDDIAACMIFAIRGNEEAGLFESLQTDDFFVSLDPVPPAPLMPASALARASGHAFPDFFSRLRGDPDLRSFAELDTVIAPGVLAFAHRLYRPAAPFAVPANSGQKIKLERKGTSLSLKIAPGSQVRGAYLFQLDQPGAGSADTLGLFLMVAVEVPIWDRYRGAMLQTRNGGGALGEVFDPVFVQGSKKVSANAVLAGVRSHNRFGQNPLTFTSRRIGAATLVSRLIASAITPGSTDWRKSDLSVTLFHYQASSAPTAHFLDRDNFESVGFSSFPLRNYRFEAGTIDDTTKIEFDSPVQNFLVDLQWTSGQNFPFFRLSHHQVTIA